MPEHRGLLSSTEHRRLIIAFGKTIKQPSSHLESAHFSNDITAGDLRPEQSATWLRSSQIRQPEGSLTGSNQFAVRPHRNGIPVSRLSTKARIPSFVLESAWEPSDNSYNSSKRSEDLPNLWARKTARALAAPYLPCNSRALSII